MSRHQISLTVLDLVFSGSLILAACASPAPASTLDNATPAIAPTVSIAATATPAPLAAKDPTTFTQFIPGDPGTLDPSIDYGVRVYQPILHTSSDFVLVNFAIAADSPYVASLPEALRARYAPLIDRGVHEIDPARRAIIYRQLNQRVFDDTLMIMLANQAGRAYMPMVVRGLDDGLSLNPMVGTYFAELSKR